MTIRDGMTSKLNRIFQAVSRTNRALETTDALSDQVNPGANFDRAASAAGRASGQVDNFNNRQHQSEEGARKVASAWGLVKKAIGSALAAISVQKVIELADSMTSTRARLDIMNDGLQTTDELQSMIMKSANRSRAAYQTTADAVSKMGIMAKDAFSNNDELIKFTELINKQFTIAGTSAAGIDAAMLQLTQAMSSGVLRGEELNSVFEQAPTIIQTIADYLDVPIGKIRDMAADGQITSTIVKNAMLASADEINAKFEAMPMTFAQVWTIAKNIALEAFTPVIQAIGSGAQWIYDNWSTIAPIFWGLASAALAYAVALGIQTAATWIADGAAKAFFTTLLTNPLFWIALAVGVVVAALYRMIQAVGGVKNAWEICKAALVVAWAALKVAFFATYNWIANLIDKLKLCWQRAGVAIAGYMGDMKVNVLTILQNMVNGAIDIINKFIKDRDVLWLLDMIIDSTEGPGIPIGNHTSQWFAVLYLSGMDHMIKERLGIKMYGRYMDDFYLIHPDKDYLRYCLEEIKKYLVPLGLELNQKTAIFPLTQGIDFLGFRTYLTDTGKVVRKVRRESKNRIRRKLKKYRHLLDEGRIDFETILQSYSSWTGHAEHGNSYHLIRKTDDLFFNLFKNELEGLTYGKITIRFARWKHCQVDEHKIQRESDQVDRGNPGHSQRPNGPGSRENDHPEMLRREGIFEPER